MYEKRAASIQLLKLCLMVQKYGSFVLNGFPSILLFATFNNKKNNK